MVLSHHLPGKKWGAKHQCCTIRIHKVLKEFGVTIYFA
jgi:hypothetical protein